MWDGITPQAIYNNIISYAGEMEKKGVAPHDLRRSFAKLAHKGGAAIDQMQLSLGHESIQGRRPAGTSRRRIKADYCRLMQRGAGMFPWWRRSCSRRTTSTRTPPPLFMRAYRRPTPLAQAQRFEMRYTPKKSSQLNVAEVELSACRATGETGYESFMALPWNT